LKENCNKPKKDRESAISSFTVSPMKSPERIVLTDQDSMYVNQGGLNLSGERLMVSELSQGRHVVKSYRNRRNDRRNASEGEMRRDGEESTIFGLNSSSDIVVHNSLSSDEESFKRTYINLTKSLNSGEKEAAKKKIDLTNNALNVPPPPPILLRSSTEVSSLTDSSNDSVQIVDEITMEYNDLPPPSVSITDGTVVQPLANTSIGVGMIRGGNDRPRTPPVTGKGKPKKEESIKSSEEKDK